jgi:hypothetical protein
MSDFYLNILTWILVLSGILGWLSLVIAGFYIWLSMGEDE